MLLHFSTNFPISRHYLIKIHLNFLSYSLYLGIEKHGSSKIETMNKSPHISNCSVASDYLGKFFILIFFINNAVFLTFI